jgi:hypothetical protein
MSKSGGSSGKPKNSFSDSHIHQISVLRAMSGGEALEPRPIPINEITLRSGLNEEKEIQRALYILEGQKLVSPFPEGDFTSRTWCITKEGMRALKLISMSAAA